MVKNTKGGSGHKKFARKHVSSKAGNRLRVSEDEGEIYAIATRMLGNNMFYAHCIDNELRLCHIRGKFTGRGKRDNTIVAGTWVLVGIREWEEVSCVTEKKKIQHCDILEVYTEFDKERLKETLEENWSILTENDTSRATPGEIDDSGLQFLNDKDMERNQLVEEMNSETIEKIAIKSKNEDEADEDWINVDDI